MDSTVKISNLGLCFCVLLVLILPRNDVKADISYHPGDNAIMVADFPEDMPCTLAHLLIVDRNFGWRKIWFDETNNAYTLDCSLMIGSNNGKDTFFKIGAERRAETLIVRGNVMIMPYWRKGDIPGKYWGNIDKRINRLTIGDADNKEIKGILKMDCSNEARRGVYSGHILKNRETFYDAREMFGGQLEAYNSEITAAGTNPVEEIKLNGDRTVLSNSVVSNVKSVFSIQTFLEYRIAKIVNTVFRNVWFPIYQAGTYSQEYEGCVFEECRTVFIRQSGSMYGKGFAFNNCVFTNNRKTWELAPAKDPVVLTDCEFSGENKEGHGDQFITHVDKKTGNKSHAQLISRRHVIVEVRDESGRPVAGAAVRIKAEQPATGLIENLAYMTDSGGRTPGKDKAGAILLLEYTKISSAIRDQPQTVEFSYELAASKDGKTAELKGVKPGKSPKTVQLIIK